MMGNGIDGMPTFVLAGVCLVLVFVLYIVSGGWRKYGGIFGILKWAQASANRDTGDMNKSNFSKKSKSHQHEDVVEVLRQVYQEFDEKHDALLQRIELLERELDAVKSHSMTYVSDEMQQVIDVPHRAESQTPVEELGHVEREEQDQNLYFKILDLLENGRTEQEIATMLSVPRSDVSYVRRIMFDSATD